MEMMEAILSNSEVFIVMSFSNMVLFSGLITAECYYFIDDHLFISFDDGKELYIPVSTIDMNSDMEGDSIVIKSDKFTTRIAA